MTLRNTKWSSPLLGAALLLTVTGAAGAQDGTKQSAAKPSSSAIAQKDAGGAASEGIKVHGDWTIIVRNPDGTVASRHEFKNALQSGAGAFLASVLARGASVGRWFIVINGPACLDPIGNPSLNCIVTEPGLSVTGFPTFGSPTLSVSAPQSGPDAGMFVLKGTARAVSAANIVSVETRMAECPATSSPANPCAAGPERRLTAKGLAAIPVAADQTIDIIVKISFS